MVFVWKKSSQGLQGDWCVLNFYKKGKNCKAYPGFYLLFAVIALHK